jgi:uncharacterized protein YndB with AHSA1/START domain
MSKYGKLIDADTIQFKRLLPCSIEQVWSYLVESDKRAKWLASGNTELKIGGAVELSFRNTELSELPDQPPAEQYKDMPETVSFIGKVTHCSLPSRLSFTWPGEGEDSEVTFELEQSGDQVLLTVTHTRINKRDDLLSASAGWHTHLDILVDVVNGQRPQPFWSAHNALELEYEKRT